MNWKIQSTSISNAIQHVAYFDADANPLSYRSVVELWAEADATFRGFHSQVLSDIPFTAFKWETPVVDLDRFDRPFEFVALNAPGLNRAENPDAFEEHFAHADDREVILQFPNLGRNAILVVPKPCGFAVDHCHLAAFLATCDAADESGLWRNVGQAMLKRVSEPPVWLSTAGGGVAWLHVRLDDRPKYYGYAPFRES